jgi:polyphosphate glucokinase
MGDDDGSGAAGRPSAALTAPRERSPTESPASDRSARAAAMSVKSQSVKSQSVKSQSVKSQSVMSSSAIGRKDAKPRQAHAARKPLVKDLGAQRRPTRRVLVVDVGGSSVKILASCQSQRRSFPSGPTLTPKRMVEGVKKLAADWTYEVVSIGYPGAVLNHRPTSEPPNLGRGWVGFDFARAFGCPVKVLNDAAMQALGSYQGGKMLFLGLGTGLGTAMIIDGIVAPMELSHLPYRKGTYEDYVGRAGLERNGRKKWRGCVADVAVRLIAALQPDDTVIGGGNVTKLKELPPNCRRGQNANAFRGGFRLWAIDDRRRPGSAAPTGAA